MNTAHTVATSPWSGVPETVGEAIRSLMRTDAHAAGLVLRLTLAVVMVPHGAQKLLGWFGGPGLDGSMSFLTGMVGLPAVLALLVILIESLGAVALLVGFLGRIAAAGIAAVMVGAVATTHWSNGFFMNWSGTLPGEGFEYHLLALGIALAIMIRGSGTLSVDGALSSEDGEA